MNDRQNQQLMQLGTFSIDNQLFGVNILSMREILRPQDLTKVPCSIPEVLGVINLRGQVIPVISLRVAMGVPVRPYDQETRIIIVKIKDICIGLMVDSIGHVRQINAASIEDAPSVTTTDEASHVDGVIQDGDKIILLLSLENVIKSETLKQLSEVMQATS